eukprot:comp19234_c0_seq1/m.22004 comp19234_c0_seq1/g.22004  ORF comp19234_c0_seq1/g.22004 comp19234_c0_seq1/m.22004 type:complete len:217 (-) comp19234_c0_seq1:514-1164(-)
MPVAADSSHSVHLRTNHAAEKSMHRARSPPATLTAPVDALSIDEETQWETVSLPPAPPVRSTIHFVGTPHYLHEERRESSAHDKLLISMKNMSNRFAEFTEKMMEGHKDTHMHRHTHEHEHAAEREVPFWAQLNKGTGSMSHDVLNNEQARFVAQTQAKAPINPASFPSLGLAHSMPMAKLERAGFFSPPSSKRAQAKQMGRFNEITDVNQLSGEC